MLPKAAIIAKIILGKRRNRVEIIRLFSYFNYYFGAYMIDKFISSRQIATPRKSQMTKVIHSDFLTVAEAMTSAF